MPGKTLIHTSKFSQLAYRKLGSGPVLVLLHGFPETGSLWQRVLPLLEKDCTLIVPDFPGTGDSTLPEGELSMEDMAESVRLILDNEEVDKAVIAGHSMGGYAAFAFADMYPERLKGLSLVHSLATADTEEKKETRRKAIALVEKGRAGKEAFIRQMIPNLFAASFKKEHPEVIEDEIGRALALNAESMIAFYNAMINRPDRRATLTVAEYPVQWIVGDEDNIASVDAVMQQTTLASVNFVSVFPDCGHMSMIEYPELLSRNLRDFVLNCIK